MDPATLLADPTSIRLEKIIQHPGSLTLVVEATRAQAEMVKGFIQSDEYRHRFGE